MSSAARSTLLYLRLPPDLRDQLRDAADREANTPSAVARRLIATGLSRERCDAKAALDVKAEREER